MAEDVAEHTPWIPGQAPVPGMNYGRLTLPGINDGAPRPAPYGMTPGQRHVLPDAVNLDSRPTPEKIDLDAPDFGNRADGTPKGSGFLGALKRPDGNVSTELSIGVNIDGKETEIPTLVPTLTPEERSLLLSLPEGDASKVPQSIVDKAVAFARTRAAAGKSPFADNSESPQAQAAPQGPITGWRVRNAKGEVVSELPVVNNQDYQKSQVQKVADALMQQAVTPDDKESAARTGALMLSWVGSGLSAGEITKRGMLQYDTDERNSISRAVQEAKNKRALMMAHGGPAPGTPTKGQMAEHKLDDDLMNRVDKVVSNEATANKLNSLNSDERDMEKLASLMNGATSIGQRIAVQEELKNLTGKVSVASERSVMTGAAGKWDELMNKLSMWTSTDPQLSNAYKQQFLGMVATQRAALAAAKEKLGREVGAGVYAETAGYPDEQRQAAADAGYGRITGKHVKAYVPAEERAAQQKPPAAGGAPASSVDSDLLK